MRTKESIGAFYQKEMFYLGHEPTAEMVDRVKKVVSGNNNLIQLYMDLGEVTDERLVEIREDEELQNGYAEMMRKIRNGGRNVEEVKSQLLSVPIDETCGWFEYFREYHEKRFDTELISPEEKARCR